jgi:hypothetical protein
MTLEKSEEVGIQKMLTSFTDNLQSFTLLRRYRTSEENSFYRALHELQLEKELGHGGQTTPPIAVDVSVNSQEEK